MVCVCVYECVFVCLFVCVFVCVCMSVCVCSTPTKSPSNNLPAQNLAPATCTSSNNITLTPKRNLHPPSYAISPKPAVSSMPPQRDPTYEEIPSFAPQMVDDCDSDKETDAAAANIYDSAASEKDRGVFQSLENKLDRSKPYLPVLESSSQLVESIVVEDPDRIVIDVTPGKKKKGTKRKNQRRKRCATYIHLHTCKIATCKSNQFCGANLMGMAIL